MTNFETQTVLTSEFGSLNPTWLTSREAYRYIVEGLYKDSLPLGEKIADEYWTNPITSVFMDGASKTQQFNPYNFLYKLRDSKLIECVKHDGRVFFNRESIDELGELIEMYTLLAEAAIMKDTYADLCDWAYDISVKKPQVLDALFNRHRFGKMNEIGESLCKDPVVMEARYAHEAKFRISFWAEISKNIPARDALGLGQYKAA